MNRWWSLAIAAAAILVAGGALGWVWWRTQAGTDSAATQPQVDLATPALLPGAAGQLSVWAFKGSVPGTVWERITAEFQKTSGYLIKLTVYESEEKYREALRQAMSTHTLPDVFLVESIEAEAMRQAGHLAMIDLAPSDTSDWVPAAITPFQRGAKVMAYPSEFNLLVLYYNSAAFDRIGVAYPDVHWTWSTMVSISQGIYRAPEETKGDPFYGMELPWGMDLWQAFSCQAGGGLYMGSSWVVGDPKYAAAQLKALTFLRDYVRKYVVVVRPPEATSGRLFLLGRAGMAIGGAELAKELRRRPDIRWGVAPLPRDDKRATVLEARGWAVSSLSNHLPDAAKLAKAFASQPTRNDWIPAQNGKGTGGRSAVEQVFYESAAYAEPPPVIATAPEVERMMSEELLRWIQSPDPSPEAMLDWAVKMFPH